MDVMSTLRELTVIGSLMRAFLVDLLTACGDAETPSVAAPTFCPARYSPTRRKDS